MMKCAEVWASNRSTSSVADLPGLRAWVHCCPIPASDAGGDVHYLSVCPNCTLSRVALADVSGHGVGVQSVGAKLRELMRVYLEALEQRNLMRDLNDSVLQRLDGVHYATMVAIGFHHRRGLLVLTNAGHPPPLWYRKDSHRWEWLEPRSNEQAVGFNGTPLGLLPNVSYARTVVRPNPGDLIVLYSDGVSEARNAKDEELGRDRLMAMARCVSPRSPESFGRGLRDLVKQFRGSRAPEDDETMIVLQLVPR